MVSKTCPEYFELSATAGVRGRSDGDRDRWARGRRQVDRRAGGRARGSGSRIWIRRDVPLRRAGVASERGVAPAEVAAGLAIALGERVLLDGRDVTERSGRRRSPRPPHVVAADPAVSDRDGRAAAPAAGRRRLGRRGPGHRHGRRARAELKVFLTADPAERARRRAAELGADAASGAGRADDPRRARQHARTRRCEPAADAVVLDTTGAARRAGRRADRGARGARRQADTE